MSKTALGLAVVFVLLLARAAFAFDQVGPTQAGTSRNQQASASGANVITIAAVTNQRVRIYSLSGQCASGAASVTITNGGTTIWSGTSVFTTTFLQYTFPVPLMGSPGAAVVITTGNCFGGGGASTVNLQADQY